MTELTTRELLDRIHCADSDTLNQIITAVEERFREIWPDWDLLVISCRGRTPEDHIAMLQKSILLLSGNTAKDLP